MGGRNKLAGTRLERMLPCHVLVHSSSATVVPRQFGVHLRWPTRMATQSSESVKASAQTCFSRFPICAAAFTAIAVTRPHRHNATFNAAMNGSQASQSVELATTATTAATATAATATANTTGKRQIDVKTSEVRHSDSGQSDNRETNERASSHQPSSTPSFFLAEGDRVLMT